MDQEIKITQGLPDIETALALSLSAMEQFGAEDIATGYNILKPYWPLPMVEIDNLANQTATQWPVVQQRFGRSLGIEFVKKENVGESFVRFTHVQKFEKHALRWIFTFYRPGEHWVINSVTFDDQIDLLFSVS